jgi:two-component sensor histidine kinase
MSAVWKRNKRALIIALLLSIAGCLILLRPYFREGPENSAAQQLPPGADRRIESGYMAHDSIYRLYEKYINTGNMQLYSGNADSAIAAYRKAVGMATEYRTAGRLFDASVLLAGAYNASDAYDSSLLLINALLAGNHEMTASRRLSLNVLLLGAYSGKRNMEKAAEYYELVSAGISGAPENVVAGNAYIEMIKYNLMQRNFAAARALSIRAEGILTKHKLYDCVKEIYGLRFRADTAEHRLEAAYLSFDKYREMADSLALMHKEKNVAAMERQFNEGLGLQDKLNEQQMQILLAREKLQEAALRQSRTHSYILIGGAVVTAVFLIISLIIYRLKRRHAILLQQQKLETDQQHISLRKMVDGQIGLIREKEWLVKEVHHRVESNLQLIVSLLSFQSRYLIDEAAVSAIKDSQNRIRAMSFIHQRLYQSESLQHVNIQEYVRELTDYLKHALELSQPVQFSVDVVPVDMDIAQAVPLGLILNEAITNAIKYAFVKQMDGIIVIKLEKGEGAGYRLRIKDNGVGMPADFDWKKSKSLGFTLIQTMAEQIGAAFSVNGANGVEIVLSFTLRETKLHEQTTVKPYA